VEREGMEMRNVFVFNTGRCASSTFAAACRHITNYSTGLESRTGSLGRERLAYPDAHIEVDNRLAWFLGRLDEIYGDQAFYVHLVRNREETAVSYTKRYQNGIIRAYRSSILLKMPDTVDPLSVCRDYWDTVNSNIRLFLKDKSHTMTFHLDDAHDAFRRFWQQINAEGDLAAALPEWNVRHNSTRDVNRRHHKHLPLMYAGKLDRIVRKLPRFLKEV
jgi:hypothetical protein